MLENEFNQRVKRATNQPVLAKRAQQQPPIVGVIAGDGIGPLLITQAKRVLLKLAAVKLVDIPAMSLDERIAAHQSLPEAARTAIDQCDVILKGPLASPPANSGMPSANAAMRQALDLYANMRPIGQQVYFRENLEGPYLLGDAGMMVSSDVAIDFVVSSHHQVQRLAKRACEFAVRRGLTRVAVVTKANVVRLTDGNFLADCQSVAADYPNLTLAPYHIDAFAAQLHVPEFLAQFDVAILPNLYGDIVTDIAAQLQGGLGTAGAGNIGDAYAVFEAIHGTAPALIAQGLADFADPRSILQAVGMLLAHLGKTAEASRLQQAIAGVFGPDAASGRTTKAVVDAILAQL